jgi:transglutaminase-like putative cysteine protease
MPRYLPEIILLILSISLISFGAAYGPETSTRSLPEIESAVVGSLDLGNSDVEQTAVTIAKDYPGEYNINQVCEIFNTLRKGWFYFSDPSYTNKYKNANRTLQDGKISNTIGMGNCDDFAILMSSLIASLGGSTRITFASSMSSTEGHAYCEVFLCQENDSQVDELTNWIKAEYNLTEIP